MITKSEYMNIVKKTKNCKKSIKRKNVSIMLLSDITIIILEYFYILYRIFYIEYALYISVRHVFIYNLFFEISMSM